MANTTPLLEAIEKLNQARDEMRAATAEAHASTKDLRGAIKQAEALQRGIKILMESAIAERVESTIEEAVKKELLELGEKVGEVTERMHQDVIAAFTKLSNLSLYGNEEGTGLSVFEQIAEKQNAALTRLQQVQGGLI